MGWQQGSTHQRLPRSFRSTGDRNAASAFEVDYQTGGAQIAFDIIGTRQTPESGDLGPVGKSSGVNYFPNLRLLKLAGKRPVARSRGGWQDFATPLPPGPSLNRVSRSAVP